MWCLLLHPLTTHTQVIPYDCYYLHSLGHDTLRHLSLRLSEAFPRWDAVVKVIELRISARKSDLLFLLLSKKKEGKLNAKKKFLTNIMVVACSVIMSIR